MAPSLLLYYRGTSPSVKSRSGQGICFCAQVVPSVKSRSGQGIYFCAQVVPARGDSIAARDILTCIGNPSAGR